MYSLILLKWNSPTFLFKLWDSSLTIKLFIFTLSSLVAADGESASTAERDVFGVGYNLGGGVLIEVAHGTKEEVDGVDNLKDTEADVTLAKLSFGF